jgi:4-hydroxy-tetrahydrodipicolinate synthase
MPKKYSRSEIRAAMTGPMPSLTTPFNRDGSIDYESLRRLIDFNLEAGAKTLMLTVGDSHYIAMSEEEIADVTKFTVKHTAGRALIIAADRYYNTKQSIEFAHFAKETGADVLMVLPPDWSGSCTPQSLVEHYKAVAEVMPVMPVTNVFGPRGQKFGLETLEILRDTVPNIVAIKDDLSGEFCRKLGLLVHDHWAIVCGGQKQNHYAAYLYGCDGYLSSFLTLNPKIAHAYWAALQKSDTVEIRRIIKDIDMPFYDLILPMPGGFDAGMHAALELVGLTQRWRRKPYYSLNDEEMEKFRAELKKRAILD